MGSAITTLRQINPEAAEMWDYERNGDLTPDTISGKSDMVAYFHCLQNPKHIFSKKISKMTSYRDGHNTGCIYCGPNAKIPFPGENDFLTLCPSAKDMWDYDKNAGMDPSTILPKSSKYAYFKCEKGHSTYRKIFDFYAFPKCSQCEKEKTKLIHQFPNTAIFWDCSKNTDVKLDDIVKSMRYNASFKCPHCKYEWNSGINIWIHRNYCPCCGFDGTDGSMERNRQLILDNPVKTFRMVNPSDSEMWRYDLNGDMTPDNTLNSSSKIAYFRCREGHEFKSVVNAMTDSKGRPSGCTLCNLTKRKTFFEVCPEAKEMWDYELNPDVDPAKISFNSGVTAHFICPNGHKFEKRIQQFTKYPFCRECYFYENHSITVTRPDLLKFWDYDKNTLSPDKISPNSSEEAYWKCQNCGYAWTQKIAVRGNSRKGKCPSCDMNRVFLPDQVIATNFRGYNPKAAELWIDELNNGITPDNIAAKSGKTVFMRCINNPKHIYQKKISEIPLHEPYGCPNCIKERYLSIPGKTDLFTVCEKAKEMWDYDKNTGIDTSNIYPKLQDKVWWKCKEGHGFERAINQFVISQNCPCCRQINGCIASYPHLVKQWDFKKNKGIDINLTSASSKMNAWWRCKKCGYEWQAQIASRKVTKGLCPCCENRTVISNGITDLFSLVPELKKFYDSDKNVATDITTLSVSSAERLWWKCPDCGYEWQCAPAGRLYRVAGDYIVKDCPSCAGLIRTKTYAEEFPDLEYRFSDELNRCRFDELTSKDYKSPFWWHCDICGENFIRSLNAMVRSRQSSSKGCPYCSGKRVTKENSFAALHPEIMGEYAPDNSIDPYSVTEHSTRLVKWICKINPSHTWKASFQSRSNGHGGCDICRIYNYSKMFHEVHADFEQYYDAVKNERPFISYSAMSNELVWWKCQEGHSFQWSIANFSQSGRFVCKICENRLLSIGENDLESQYPELALEFDAEKNKTSADHTLITSSDDNTWWKCANGHAFQRSVWYRINRSGDCPICSRSIVVKGINDFKTTYPEIDSIWDYEQNEKGPDEISDRCNKKFYFKCDKNHHYESYLRSVVDNNFECLLCNETMIQKGINSLFDTDMKLAMELSHNEERSPYELGKSSAYRALWHCPVCNGEYRFPINERKVGDDSCPYCSNRKALPGFNSLDVMKKELIPEWSPNNEQKMCEFPYTSSYIALWVCPTCNGEYSARIRDRYVGDDSCPYCTNRRVLPGFNALDDVKKELIPEWSPNNEQKMCEFPYTSSYIALWICPTCNGEYPARIRDRYAGDDSCPYCTNRRVLPGYNSFKQKYSSLVSEEWDYMSNYLLCDPDSILPSYHENVWWKCNRCGNKYSMSPKQRLLFHNRNMSACPFCKGYRRKKNYYF